MPSKKSNSTTNAPHGFENKLHGLGIRTYGAVGDKYRADCNVISKRTGDYKNAAVPALTSFVVDNEELFKEFIDGYWVATQAAIREKEVADILERFPELTMK